MAVQKLLKQLNKKVDALRAVVPKVPEKKKARKKITGIHPKEETMRIEMGLADVIKVTLVVLVVYYLSSMVTEITGLVVTVFLSIIIASALTPAVDWLQKKRVPRVLGTLLVYAVVLALITLILSSFVPVIAEQLFALAVNLSDLLQNLVHTDLESLPVVGRFAPDLSNFLDQISSDQLISQIQSGMKAIANSLYAIGNSGYIAIKTVFGGLFTAFTVFVLSFYMVIEKNSVEESLANIVPERHAEKFMRLNRNIQSKLGAWLRGQMTVSLTLGILSWIALKIIGIPYAATLGLFTGIITVIPYVGAALSAIIPIGIAFTISPWSALFVVIAYIAIQSLEGNLITPLIMNKAVDLNPVTIIIVLLMGAELFGVMGVILAIPVTAAVAVFIDDWQMMRKG